MIWMWFACLFRPPEYLLYPNQVPHPDCAADTDVRAVGFDAEQKEVAEQRAKVRLVESIASTVRTTTVSQNQVVKQGVNEESNSNFQSMSIVESTFPYYDVIQIVPPVYHSKKGYIALACLKVTDLEDRIRQKHSTSLQQIEQATSSAVRIEGIEEFSQLYSPMKTAMEPLLADFELLRSLSGSPTFMEMQVLSQLQSLDAKAERLRIENPITLVHSGNGLEETVQQKMRTAGLKVNLSEACQANTGYIAEIVVEEKNGKGPMGGHVVSLDISLRFSECGGTNRPKTVKVLQSQGYHSSNVSIAQTQAMSNLSAATISPEFGLYFPLK